jgi:hypothetical protein
LKITHYDPPDDDPIFTQGFVVTFPYQARSTGTHVVASRPTLAPGEEGATSSGPVASRRASAMTPDEQTPRERFIKSRPASPRRATRPHLDRDDEGGGYQPRVRARARERAQAALPRRATRPHLDRDDEGGGVPASRARACARESSSGAAYQPRRGCRVRACRPGGTPMARGRARASVPGPEPVRHALAPSSSAVPPRLPPRSRAYDPNRRSPGSRHDTRPTFPQAISGFSSAIEGFSWTL